MTLCEAQATDLNKEFEGKTIVFRWDLTGYAKGVVVKHLPKATTQNFNVLFPDGVCGHMLTWDKYSAEEGASSGHWAVVNKAKGLGAVERKKAVTSDKRKRRGRNRKG